VALVPGVLAPALRRDVVAVDVLDAPTRGIYASLPATTPSARPPWGEHLVTALREAVIEASRHRNGTADGSVRR
jgi:hypothetical protein